MMCEQSSECEGYCILDDTKNFTNVNMTEYLKGICTPYVKPALSYNDKLHCNLYLDAPTKKINKDLLVCRGSVDPGEYSDTWLKGYEWKLQKYKVNGAELAVPNEKHTPTMIFSDGPLMKGNDGCMNFQANYVQEKGKISFADIKYSLSTCKQDETTILQEKFFDLLKEKVFISYGKLVFQDELGDNALIFSNEEHKLNWQMYPEDSYGQSRCL